MVFDPLIGAWRVAYGVIGSIFLLVGVLGTFAEVYLALQGYNLAWLAAVLTVLLAILGGFLIHGVYRGRIRSLGIGRRPPAV